MSSPHVLLYVPGTLLRHEGIRRRAAATVGAWNRLGARAEQLQAPFPTDRTDPASLLWRHLVADKQAAEQALSLLGSGEMDHVVARLLVPTPAWREVAATGRLSLEVHNPVWRAESKRDVARVVLGGPMARYLARRSAAGFFVTRELSNLKEFRGIPRRLALGNGIQLGEVLPAPDNSRTRLGMVVGGAAKWHGLDRFARWAHDLPEIDFVVVCPAQVAPSLDVTSGRNLEVLPTSSLPEFRQALAGLDAAVGSMAFDRWNLSEGAPLKVRDYVDAGIPTILPYVDTNLSDCRDPMLLQLPRWQETGTVSRWLTQVRGRRLSSATRSAISIDTIEESRLNMIVDSLSSAGAPA